MKKVFTTILVIFIALILNGCSGEPTSSKESGHSDAHESNENTTTTTFTAEQIKSIKLETGSIEQKQLTASLRATGILRVPNQNRASVTSLQGGIVKSILVQPGNEVKKGQVLVTITNPQFVLLQEDYLMVASKMQLAELEYDRQKELNDGNAGSLKNLQQSQSEFNALKTRKSSLQRQLELIGISTNNLTNKTLQSTISLTSPIAGSVSSLSVNIGSNVEANMLIAEIVDNSQLHLDLFIYEKDLPRLKIGQTIHFTLTNNPGKEYDADIFGVGNTFEENTKAIAVHAAVKGNKTGLIDGMNITALVSLEKNTLPAVPTEAIVNHDGQDYIFIVSNPTSEKKGSHKVDDHDHGDDHDHDEAKADKHVAENNGAAAIGSLSFEKIPIKKGTTDVGYSEITLLKYVPKDAKIVTKGAFFVNAKMTNQGEAHSH